MSKEMQDVVDELEKEMPTKGEVSGVGVVVCVRAWVG